MRRHSLGITAAAALSLVGLAALGCSEGHDPVSVAATRPAFLFARTPVTFTVGPLALAGIEVSTPGGNLHFRDILLSGAVNGDLEGTADITLNADLDGLGNGPAWGTMTITAGTDVWQGDLVGHFQGDLPTGILLSSQVTLHGPRQQLLKAECDEIPPANSETLACTGEIVDPHQ
jgi:hypothetical protein